MATRWLLLCGILAALLYGVMLVVVPLQWPEYRSASWTVSELSAIGAPTRSLWVSLGMLWTVLYVGFGVGVWRAAAGTRALHAAAGLLVGAGILGCFWPPMHQREVLAAGGASTTDTLHVVWSAATSLLTVLAISFSAATLGKPFRRYSIATIAVLVVAGALTARDAGAVDANLPTPWIGVWERVNIGAWLVWVAVLALILLRRALRSSSSSTGSHLAEQGSWS
jgi:hypothetical protein